MKKNILILLILVSFGNICLADAYYDSPPSNVPVGESGVTPVYTSDIYKLMKQISATPSNLNLHLQLAQLYETNGYSTEAVDEYEYIFNNARGNKEILGQLENLFKEKVSKYRNYDTFHIYLGMVYQQKGEREKALEEYQQAIELNPPGVAQRVALASLYIDEKDYFKAVPILDAILATYPHNIKARMQKANALLAMGLKDKAVAEYKTVLEMQPTNFEAKIAVYDILKSTVCRDDVIKTLYKEYANTPVGILAYYKLAGDLRLAKKYNDAIYFYKLTINIDPRFSEAYIDLADTYTEIGNQDAAKSLLETAQAALPNDSEIKNKYKSYSVVQPVASKLTAEELIKKGDYEEAIKSYSEINPPTVESLIGIASCYQYQTKYNEALEYLNKALAIDPSNSDIYYNFGFLYLNKEDYNSAKTSLNKSLELSPENPKSKKLLLFVIEQETNKLSTQILSEYDNKNYAKAMSLIDTMLKAYPDNADAYYYKGLVLAATGKNNLAIPEFQSAIKNDANYAMAYYSLAVAYDAVKKRKEALDNYNKFLSLSKEQNEYTAYAKKRVIKLK